MEFTEVVRGRRAVRKYRSTPVSVDQLRELIELAVWAPSAMNRQPWGFAVIDDAVRIEECAASAKQYYLAHEEVTNDVRALLEDPAHNIFHHAPALVLVLAKSDAEQAREDCCLAAQTLMLAARNAGLGSCWVGFSRPWLNLPETRAAFKLPQHCRVVAPIVVGYPVEWPPVHGRTPAEIHWPK
jgi:nitroreductase